MDKGFTLIEILILIAIVGVLAAVATPLSADFIDRHRLSGASRELYASIQEIRLSAMTKTGRGNPDAPDPWEPNDERGYGIGFDNNGSYIVFLLINKDGALNYIQGNERRLEWSQLSQKGTLPKNVTLTVEPPEDGAVNMLTYDKKGIPRDANFDVATARDYVLTNSRGVARCVSISTVRIREGTWNGSSCDTQ